jgi:hypothetical protein
MEGHEKLLKYFMKFYYYFSYSACHIPHRTDYDERRRPAPLFA